MENNPRLSKFLTDPFYYSGNQEPGTHKWTDTDTKQRFKQNVKQQQELMKSTGWIDAPLFDYNINKHGFRGSWNINTFIPKSIMALGCSNTLGLGLPEEQTWPSILSVNQGMSVYNLGLPGCGLEAAYRVASFWIPRLCPKYVCLLLPEVHRREIWNPVDQKWSDIGSWNINDSPLHRQLMSDEECWIASSRAVYALDNLCVQHSAKFFLLYPRKSFFANVDITGQFARDLSHPGYAIMQQIADQFSDAILHQRYFKEFFLDLADG